MESWVPDRKEFLHLPTEAIHELIYDRQLSISLLLNGTRRWYLASHYDAPPTDTSYFPHYLETALCKMGELVALLAEHGFYRVFMPAYSWHQSTQNSGEKRNPEAHKYLIKAIDSLATHHSLADAYRKYGCAVKFYGDMADFSDEFAGSLRQPPIYVADKPNHVVYYGVDGSNPHNYALQLAYRFSKEHGRAPTWEDMLEVYYGDRTMRPLDILVNFNRVYARLGVPYLLDGEESIYITAVTPLVLSQESLRTILYDFLFHRQDRRRDYQFVHPDEFERLKQFYAVNRDSIVGLTQKYEDLVYPLPTIQWPKVMDKKN
jgi:hypothetical protein